ncbi:Serine/threonine-protein phosphatase [Naviculisporaceae sp. PSN 640]
MASSPSNQEARRNRLRQLASEWGVVSPPALPPLTPISPAPSFRTPNDDFLAEELLKRQRFTANQGKDSRGGIKRAFSSGKTWEPKEIFDALEAHVANCGAPGVADALIAKLLVVGGNPNLLQAKSRGSILGRRKSMESMERSRVLQKAIEHRQIDMVTVLAQHADPFTLDAALPLAIRTGDARFVQILLSRGANTTQTQDAQDAFRQLCIVGGHADMVGLILQSEGRPPPEWVSIAMVDAARKGCLATVLRISRSTADGGYQNAEALKHAIAQCRVDIALAILTGTRPPNPGSRGLVEAFTQLFQHPTIGPNEKMALTESLLCAGANGDAVSIALSQACIAEFYELVDLLIFYGASVEYQNASVVKQAISQGQTSLVQVLVTEHTPLSPLNASECVAQIPKNIPPEDRHALLNILLRKGAGGTALHEALIDAVQAGDMQSVDLLVRPYFPGGRRVSGPDAPQNTRAVAFERHEMASVDHNGGQALSIATMTCNIPMVKQLLVGRPSPDTMALIFPQLNNLPPSDRYQIAECFLAAGLTGPCVSAALQQAIEERPPRRDESYISLLLRHNADVNFNEGAGILSAIGHLDTRLLEALLKKRPSPQTCAAAIAKAMTVSDKPTRYQMTRLLIEAGAGRVGTEVSEALVQLLPIKPLDVPLTSLLLELGGADANFNQSAAVILAINDPSPDVLEMVLHHGRPTPETLYQGLVTLCEMPTNSVKSAKVGSILRRTKQQDLLDLALTKEVQTLLKSPTEQRELNVIKSLLAAGASVSAHNASALRDAVKAADSPMTELLLSSCPAPTALSAALPFSLNIMDPMYRLSFTQRLMRAGASTTETNRALVYAIDKHPSDLPLIGLLASHAHSVDGEALIKAIKQGNVGGAEVILAKSPTKYSALVLDNCFNEATALKDQSEKRISVCRILLQRGISVEVLSDALLSAAADGDLALGTILLDHGASVEHQDGRAVIEASTAGAADVLAMLLNGKAKVKKRTLMKAFQAATQVGDLKKRAAVFRILLEQGVTGEIVDAQLVSAAKYCNDGEPLVRLLLGYGASVDYNSGEAIWNATRSAIMGSLRLMLGVERVGERQTKPSQATLLRALKASRKLGRDPRYQVMEWLFAAGLMACEEIHIALNRAVKDDPDIRLIRLLLNNGASPLVNACESLIDAAQRLLVDVLGVFLELDIPQKDISWAFKQAFTPDTSSTWLSQQGYEVAKMLLAKGAEGEGLSIALSTVIDFYASEQDAIAQQFGILLLESKADVSYDGGVILKKAAMCGDSRLISKVLEQGPDSTAVSNAFPHIFSQGQTEEEMLTLIRLFTEYHSGEERLDVMAPPGPHKQPVLFEALSEFPRSVKVLQTLLDAGYYHDQMTKMTIVEEIEEPEQVSLLLWALHQPQKRISSAVIALLIDRGAKVNFETSISKITPLMLAIQHRRPDLVKELILAGAEVDVMDITGNTPMTMATRIGGDLGTSMMSNILAADPSKNDGSLHNAARELNLQAMKVLIDFGHDPDFPSPLHGGRSALGELCLNATSHENSLSATQEKQMEKAITLLIESGSDLTIQSDGKSVLLLALDSADPIPTTKALLKAGTWKNVNKPYNHFTDGTYTYSPTQYVARVMPPSDIQSQLLTLLKSYRVIDVYYANDGPQPEGAINLPEELLRAERERRAFAERIAKESEEHAIALARTRELAALQNQIFTARAELEDSRARRRNDEEIKGIKQRQMLEEQGFAAELKRRKAEREAALVHERQLMESGLSRARLISEAELEMEEKKQAKMLEWEAHIGQQRVQQAKQLSHVKVKEREELQRLEGLSEQSTMRRLAEHRRLVDSQNQLAGRLTAAGANQRQIGYITGELD